MVSLLERRKENVMKLKNILILTVCIFLISSSITFALDYNRIILLSKLKPFEKQEIRGTIYELLTYKDRFDIIMLEEGD